MTAAGAAPRTEPPRPFYLPGADGPLFCLLQAPPPDTAPRGALVYLPPFAEEANRSRRMAVLQTRRLAARGWAVLLLDPFGTGNSGGSFPEARWETWQKDAETAADWGMIWKALDDDKLMDEATALARKLANGPTLGLGLTKKLIQAASTNSFDTQIDLERDFQREAGKSEDYAEGVTAFLEKRKPAYRGE